MNALTIRGLGCLSALGNGLASHVPAGGWPDPPLQPLAGLLGADSPHATLPAGWIRPRSLLCHRKWSPASMAALRVAREAAADAGWDAGMLREAALVVATSRGAAAGWLAPFPGRRAFRVMAASNSMHGEPATAVGVELGIRGPCHVLATGCSAGLDAVGVAGLLLAAGLAPRALALAVDLPLVPQLLDAYAGSRILSTNGVNDPYSPASSGMLPAEAAAAMALDLSPSPSDPRVLGHLSNSDAWSPAGVPDDGGMLAQLLDAARARFGVPAAICPHASGTAALGGSEPAAILRAFPEPPPLVVLKPMVGHAVAAGGLLEAAMLAAFLRHGRIPAGPPGLTPPPGFSFHAARPAGGRPLFKLASGLGGHNSLLALAAAPGR